MLMHIFSVVFTLFFPKCMLRLKEDGQRKGRRREGYTDSNYPLKPFEHHSTIVSRGSKGPPTCTTIILRDVSLSDRRWKCFQSVARRQIRHFSQMGKLRGNDAKCFPYSADSCPWNCTESDCEDHFLFIWWIEPDYIYHTPFIGKCIQTISNLVFELNGKFKMQLDYVKFNKKTISIPVCEFVCVPTNYINNKVCILSFEIRDTTHLVWILL